jgi:hypothetical protein
MSFLTGSSGSVSTIPNILQSSLTGPQQDASNILSQALTGNNIASFINAVYPQYQGQVAAPVSTATTQAVDALSGAIPGAATAAGASGLTQSTGLGTLANLLRTGGGDLSSYYAKNVYSPILQSFLGTTTGDIAGATGGQGNLGGSTGRTIASSLGDLGTILSSTKGTLDYDTAQQAQQNKLSALSQLSGVTQAPTTDLQTILSGGTTAQAAQQEALTKMFNLYQTGQTNTTQFLTDLINYLDTSQMTAGTQTVTTSGSSGILGSLLSVVGKALVGV